MKTSIVILTYNKLDYTKLCIESIRKYTEKDSYEIIIVDNNSTDGTVEWLKLQHDIRTIFNSENMGFPKGCNQGIEIAEGDDILLLNNDTIVTPRWLDNMTKCLYSSDDIGAVGTVTNNCSNYQSIPVNYTSIDEMLRFAEDFNQSNPELWEQRLRLVGYNMLIKGSAVKEVGLLDERFTPGNFEDDDYSLRIRRAGYKVMLCKDTFIHHFGSTSFKENAQAFKSLLRDNAIKFEEKWGFNPVYFSNIRNDIISLIDENEDKQINVLEVGCACGGTLLKIRNIYKNANLYGIELNHNAALDASLFASVISADIEKCELEYPGEFFDYIIFGDVLEHLHNPWETLKKIKRYLKSGGFILASIPNVAHYSVIKGLLNGNWTYQEAGILDRTHLRFFTLNEIDKMFEQAGYGERTYNKVMVSMSEEDKEFINKLGKLSNEGMTQQYETYQYITKAGIESHRAKIEEALINISRNTDIEKSIEVLSDINAETVIEIIDKDYTNKIELLNLVGISLFRSGFYKNVLTYLNKAYESCNKDTDTLFNLGYILSAFEEYKLSLMYLNMIEVKDKEIDDLIKVVQNKINRKNNVEKELKFILRRFENNVNMDESAQVLTDLVSNEQISSDEIIKIIEKDIIQKEKVLNITAIILFKNNFYDNVIPLFIKSYEINNKNPDMLYNLGYILFKFGEYKLAYEYLQQIEEKDNEVCKLINEIQGVMANEE